MTDNVLTVTDLSVTFRSKRMFQPPRVVKAVNHVSFDLAARETLAIVGESGSGKSTVARAIMGLAPAESGDVTIMGERLSARRGKGLRDLRRNVQMVFQDPYSSLNPSMTILESVAEPLDVHLRLGKRERAQRVGDLLELVGLSARHASRYPHEFSGGQRQRIAIARAVAVDPRIVICDEAVSALDVSTQNQIVGLLRELRDRLGTAFLFISHDLAVVRHLADRVAVMYFGQVVESGPVAEVFESPQHPYTQALLSAVPIPDPVVQRERERIVLVGEMPDVSAPPTGCAFNPRCQYAMDVCRAEAPPSVQVAGGAQASCHLLHQIETTGGTVRA